MPEAPRQGDQQLPVPNDGPSMHDLVIADLEGWEGHPGASEAVQFLLAERKKLGLQRYGSILQAGNLRDWRRDLAEELGDAAAYAMQGIAESGGPPGSGELGQVYDLIIQALLALHGIPGGGDE